MKKAGQLWSPSGMGRSFRFVAALRNGDSVGAKSPELIETLVDACKVHFDGGALLVALIAAGGMVDGTVRCHGLKALSDGPRIENDFKVLNGMLADRGARGAEARQPPGTQLAGGVQVPVHELPSETRAPLQDIFVPGPGGRPVEVVSTAEFLGKKGCPKSRPCRTGRQSHDDVVESRQGLETCG
jgi:hypothetical protein